MPVWPLSYKGRRAAPARVRARAGFALPCLAVLDVSLNALTSLPPRIGGDLPALRQLYASGNRLGGLPESLAQARGPRAYARTRTYAPPV